MQAGGSQAPGPPGQLVDHSPGRCGRRPRGAGAPSTGPCRCILGLGLHSAGVVAHSAADRENNGSVWASLPGREQREPALTDQGQLPRPPPPAQLQLQVPCSDSPQATFFCLWGQAPYSLFLLHCFPATGGNPGHLPSGAGMGSAVSCVSPKARTHSWL